MPDRHERWLRREDLTPPQSWELLAWCAGRGAEELSIDCITVEGSQPVLWDRLTAELLPWRKTGATRPTTYAKTTEYVWELRDETTEILTRYLTKGLFTYGPPDVENGWLEDPTFYREGGIMIGIISHEDEGIIALDDEEFRQIAAIGIPTHDRSRWA